MRRTWHLRGGSRWAWLGLALLGVLLFARLGLWQLDRAHQKAAWMASLSQAEAAPALVNEDVIAAMHDTQVLHRRVSLHGHWLPEHAVYLENRTMGNATGFLVLMPLALNDRVAVVVQRGWVPRHQIDPYRLPPIETPSGEVRIEGVVSDPPSAYFSLGEGGAAGSIRPNLDWHAYAQALGRDIGQWSVRQLAEASEGLIRNWDPIDAKIPTHYGYAAQWFALAALTVILYVWFQIIQPRRRRP